jgi:hypothetical protein
VYQVLWRPEELGATHAKQLIGPLNRGLVLLQLKPEHFQQFNASNGWGKYEDLVEFVTEYLAAYERYPDAEIGVSR